jgi:Ca-activated chloride channel family protein
VMAVRGPGYLHAATASETAMLKSAEVQKDVLRFPWAFIFPAEGAFWQDNPACLLDASWVSAEQREAAQTYRDYLLAFEQQDKAVQIGLRPAVDGVPLHFPISLDNGTDPRVSPQTVPPLANVSAETQAAIIDVFKETKKKATVVLVLDRSGSMEGEKLTNAQEATANFLRRLGPGDGVQLTVFDQNLRSFGPVLSVATVRDGLSRQLSQVIPGGQTALNDAICDAVKTADAARKRDLAAGEQRLYGIVLLTDGIENASTQKDVFACLPTGEDVEGVKIFTIAYGKDADAKLLKQIAERTNGKTFTGDSATIEQVYLAISAEQ